MVNPFPTLAVIAAIFLGGCASAPKNPDILRTVNYVGDDWYVAAMNTEHEVFVHAKELDKTQMSHTHVYASDRALTTYAFMRNWTVRMVNSSDEPVCARLNMLEIDYNVQVPYMWYVMEPRSTEHVGTINQVPMYTTERIYSFKNAMWAVDTLEVVPYVNKGCKTLKKK